MTRITRTCLLLLALSVLSHAGAVDVTYTVSGSAGAWELNFTVANNLGAWPQQDIYQFGVALSGPGVSGSPAGYNPTIHGIWTNFFMGGSATFYNNIWDDVNDFNHLLPGHSLSGFRVTIPDLTAPSTVAWFAFSVPQTFDPADIYTGLESFHIDPDFATAGFEGQAAAVAGGPPAVAPEPSAIIVFSLGIAGLILLRRLAR